MFVMRTRRGEFGDFVIRAHRMRIHARSLNPSRASALDGRMRVSSNDSDALRCARQVPCRYLLAYANRRSRIGVPPRHTSDEVVISMHPLSRNHECTLDHPVPASP